MQGTPFTRLPSLSFSTQLGLESYGWAFLNTTSLTLMCPAGSCFSASVLAVPSTWITLAFRQPVETLLMPLPLEYKPNSHHQLSLLGLL